ncbi:kinase-like domain-containing protein [Polychytrium aggregatum]|uniref:kinase-like domain-containing protein n=1 Tax=Polychytrium aggregatum TaxID=110093 RepID=UPI0022FE8714|nr:kinase-like domain-containing protein [Polychytrium aggregatum]KAI9208127.1 kinase-like domain-containing protein [Polychytrium aggregatum]
MARPDPSSSHHGAEPSLNSKSFNQGYYDRFFVEQKKLGRGLRGSVFLCQHMLDQVLLGEYAVKTIPVGRSHSWLVGMLREVHLLQKLRHPNIIEYKHAWLENRQLTTFGPEVPCLFILMELANGGNLEEYINIQWSPESVSDLSNLSAKERMQRLKRLRAFQEMHKAQNKPSIKERIEGGIGFGLEGKKVRYLKSYEIWSMFLDICEGLSHLHKHGIIHRDLKPPNLLLHWIDQTNQDEIPTILLSDFGECEVISDQSARARTGATGTLEFMPPELLQRDEHGSYLPNHSPKADLWSLGVVLYYLCYSAVPYTQIEDVDELRKEILDFPSELHPLHFPHLDRQRVTPELEALIAQLMQRDPDARPNVQELLERYATKKLEISKSHRRNQFLMNQKRLSRDYAQRTEPSSSGADRRYSLDSKHPDDLSMGESARSFEDEPGDWSTRRARSPGAESMSMVLASSAVKRMLTND